ncbi:unnamed protein product [Protopolystoma xenopodis]|uniref:Uncharacterized protein n=1 Tax=Protopolystoma xenopodis TaxID=117903 RepID=A0A3S5BAS0_9PLAT|nr:unnamed protein product [Protopolystoma xenopodis]
MSSEDDVDEAALIRASTARRHANLQPMSISTLIGASKTTSGSGLDGGSADGLNDSGSAGLHERSMLLGTYSGTSLMQGGVGDISGLGMMPSDGSSSQIAHTTGLLQVETGSPSRPFCLEAITFRLSHSLQRQLVRDAYLRILNSSTAIGSTFTSTSSGVGGSHIMSAGLAELTINPSVTPALPSQMPVTTAEMTTIAGSNLSLELASNSSMQANYNLSDAQIVVSAPTALETMPSGSSLTLVPSHFTSAHGIARLRLATPNIKS